MPVDPQVDQWLRDIEDRAARIRAFYDTPSQITVPAGGNLQAALDRGGTIVMEGGATFNGPFLVTKSGTTLSGNVGTQLVGNAGPALRVIPGVNNCQFLNFSAIAPGWLRSVIQIGVNDTTQKDLEHEPAEHLFQNIVIPTHRGKQGFEVNGRLVKIISCIVTDLWHPNGEDSQAICLLNSSGSLTVTDSKLCAGSEIIMIGGDSIKLVGVQTQQIHIENCVLARPLSWQTDGVHRGVKNILELKAGIGVYLAALTMSGSWKDAQTGEAFVITPRDNRVVDQVEIDNCDVSDVASCMQILGRDYTSFTDGALGIMVRNSIFRTDSRKYVGRGIVSTISGEPRDVAFVNNDFQHDGASILLTERGKVMNADKTTRPGNPFGTLTFAGNRSRCGVNGLFLHKDATGYANAGPNGEGKACATAIDVSGNTFVGPAISSLMKKNFPNNTFVAA